MSDARSLGYVKLVGEFTFTQIFATFRAVIHCNNNFLKANRNRFRALVAHLLCGLQCYIELYFNILIAWHQINTQCYRG